MMYFGGGFFLFIHFIIVLLLCLMTFADLFAKSVVGIQFISYV